MTAICLFTDFGIADPYVGQVKAALHRHAPHVPVIDLLHAAPAFNIRAGAHLLAALAGRMPDGAVIMAVVDPGVGSSRLPVAVLADGLWFVGPDNGLLSVAACRARSCRAYTIDWRPAGRLSDSFHGRDLFAPVAAMIASGRRDAALLAAPRALSVELGAADLPEVIYVDHYGNAMTGLRARSIGHRDRLTVRGHQLAYARVYSEVPPGAAFWYENSIGLAEIAVNGGSACERLGLRVGQRIDHAAVRETDAG